MYLPGKKRVKRRPLVVISLNFYLNELVTFEIFYDFIFFFIYRCDLLPQFCIEWMATLTCCLPSAGC